MKRRALVSMNSEQRVNWSMAQIAIIRGDAKQSLEVLTLARSQETHP